MTCLIHVLEVRFNQKEKRSKIPGERLCFDVSSVKARSFGGAKFWLLVMDDATGYSWSYFLKQKSDKIVIS